MYAKSLKVHTYTHTYIYTYILSCNYVIEIELFHVCVLKLHVEVWNSHKDGSFIMIERAVNS